MVSYLDILNRARARQGSEPISSTGILNNTGDALSGIQAVNEAIFEVTTNSTDLDFLEKTYSVNTTIANNVITSPSGQEWNPQMISSVKYSDGNTLTPLILVPFEQAKDIEFYSSQLTSNIPTWWYVNQGTFYIIPTPTAVYNLRIFYKGLCPDITASNITSTIDVPVDMIDALTSGVYAYVRRAIGDPEWVQLENYFKQKLSRALDRNKDTYKKKGFRRLVMQCAWADRNL